MVGKSTCGSGETGKKPIGHARPQGQRHGQQRRANGPLMKGAEIFIRLLPVGLPPQDVAAADAGAIAWPGDRRRDK